MEYLKLLSPIALQIFNIFIKYCVVKAEHKFAEASSGDAKKEWVLKKIDHYLDINPEIKEHLSEEILNDLSNIVEATVSEAINKNPK